MIHIFQPFTGLKAIGLFLLLEGIASVLNSRQVHQKGYDLLRMIRIIAGCFLLFGA